MTRCFSFEDSATSLMKGRLPLTPYELNSVPFVQDGLVRLSAEAFGPTGFAKGMDEVVHVLVHRRTNTFGHGHMLSDGRIIHKGRTDSEDFSFGGLGLWLDKCRELAYRKGQGTWTTAEVHLVPDAPGRLDLFDEERVQRDVHGNWPSGGEPAGAATWAQQLLAYPRTADNIPDWMWGIFRSEEVTPPVYNLQLGCVEWNNRRRPVSDRGTDFSAEPTIIDSTQEPGTFGKIAKKLFGGQR